MDPSAATVADIHPEPGKALVVFAPHEVRNFGAGIAAVVFDGDAIAGVSAGDTAVVYQAPPGPHRFMVVSEAADFMDAPGRQDLLCEDRSSHGYVAGPICP